MATRSVWGSVWGANAVAAADQPYEGEDACNICMQAKDAVVLHPCSHKCCEACVGELRKRLIFKVNHHCTRPSGTAMHVMQRLQQA